MKKIVSIILLLTVLVNMAAPLHAFAEGTAAVSFGTVEAKPGETVSLALNLTQNTGIAGLVVSLTYDTNVLTVAGAQNGSLFSAFSTGKNYAWDESDNVTGLGTLATFKFQVSADAVPGTYNVTVIVRDCTDIDMEDVSVTVVSHGKIVVPCDHKYGSWTTADDNNHKHTCSVCSSTETQAHTWNSGTVTKAATCKEAGVKTYTCSVCGGTKTEEIAKLTTHTFGSWTTTKAATCKEAGEKTRTCSVCGKTETDTIAKLTTHTYGNWEKVDDNNHKRTCSVCGNAETKAHTWNSGTVTKPATCKEAGVKTFTCSVCNAAKTQEIAKLTTHSFGAWEKDNNENHKHTCSVCELTETKAHNWNKGAVTKAATCKEAGVKTYTCTTCGETKTEEITKLTTHSFSKWAKVDDNSHKRVCSVCELEETGTHSYGTNWTSDAANHFHACSVCGDQKDAAAHTPGAAPTEKTAQTCTVCGRVLKAALGHTHKYAATLTKDETSHWYACSGCTEKKDAAAHSFDNACDTDCNVCGYERETEHSFAEDWKSDAQSHWQECTACGEKTGMEEHVPGEEATEEAAQTCTVCGYEVAAKLPHTHAFADEWESDADSHWQTCACGETNGKADHSWDDSGVCTVCAAQKPAEAQSGSSWLIIAAAAGIAAIGALLVVLKKKK